MQATIQINSSYTTVQWRKKQQQKINQFLILFTKEDNPNTYVKVAVKDRQMLLGTQRITTFCWWWCLESRKLF